MTNSPKGDRAAVVGLIEISPLPRITGYGLNGKSALLECSASLSLAGNVSMLDFVREFCGFLRARRKYWLIPMLIIIGVFGGVLVLANGSAVAPFIYTLF